VSADGAATTPGDAAAVSLGDAAAVHLGDLLAGLSSDDGGAYAIEPPPDWRQGRTLYGGLTAALCAEAARREVVTLPPLRSLQIAFAGPATGRVHFAPRLVRRGRSAAFVAVDARGDNGPCGRATLTYAAARDSAITHGRVDRPEVPAAVDCPPVPHRPGPAFLAHFELRLAAGGVPFSGTGDPELMMWVRHRGDEALDPAIALVAVADVLPPAATTLYREPRPVSSMTWSLEIVATPPRTGWYLLRATSESAADGYGVQDMTCWDEAGDCLTVGRQTVALF
jgi:acyl-CoA thioesterase